jgi:hypothetical protein
MMDCDCYSFKRFPQGYPGRMNVKFTHSTYDVEEKVSVQYSTALDTNYKAETVFFEEASVFCGKARAVFGLQITGHMCCM